MTASMVFTIVNLIAMSMWLLMIVLPRWKVTQLLIDYKTIPIVLSLIYAVYIVISLGGSGSMDFSSLDSVMKLFTVENSVLAGWVHYLAFDLLVGMWILDQNKQLGLSHLLIIPCLLGSFTLGPIGFLLFMVMKALKSKAS